MKNTKKTLMMAARIILALAAIANIINCFSIKKMKAGSDANTVTLK